MYKKFIQAANKAIESNNVRDKILVRGAWLSSDYTDAENRITVLEAADKYIDLNKPTDAIGTTDILAEDYIDLDCWTILQNKTEFDRYYKNDGDFYKAIISVIHCLDYNIGCLRDIYEIIVVYEITDIEQRYAIYPGTKTILHNYNKDKIGVRISANEFIADLTDYEKTNYTSCHIGISRSKIGDNAILRDKHRKEEI